MLHCASDSLGNSRRSGYDSTCSGDGRNRDLSLIESFDTVTIEDSIDGFSFR